MRIRFGLKSTFFLTAICAFMFANFLPGILERATMKRLARPGVQLFTEPRGQYFMRQLIGDTYSHRVVYIHLDGPEIDDDWLAKLDQFPYAEYLSVRSSKVTDAGLEHLKALPHLKSLDLVDTRTTQQGQTELKKASRSLVRLAAYASDAP